MREAILYSGETCRVETTIRGERYYVIDGVRYWSVTTIINRVTGGAAYRHIPADVLESAQDRGTRLHEYIASRLMGGKEKPELGELGRHLSIHADAFDEWARANEWEPDFVERVFVSRRLGYAGTPDQVWQDSNRYAKVIDIKPMLAPYARVQLAAYALAIKECLDVCVLVRRSSLHLFDGECREQIHRDHALDRDAWLSTLSLHNYGLTLGWW